MKTRLAVFTDFDGTVTTVDSLQRLLTVFTGDAWRRIEDEVEAGRIGDRRSLQAEFDLVHASRAEATAVVDRDVAVDPAFPPFAAWLGERGVPFTVLSGGFASIIRRVLRRHGLRLEVRANEARVTGGRWRVIPSRRRRLCGECNHCKSASIVRAKRAGARTVFIGNGVTDRCPAGHADLVFAKGVLAAHCRREGIRYRRYRTFADVHRALVGEVSAAQGLTDPRTGGSGSPGRPRGAGRGYARRAASRRSGPRSFCVSGGRW